MGTRLSRWIFLSRVAFSVELDVMSSNTLFYYTNLGTRLSIRGGTIGPRATLVSACTGNIACAVGGPITVGDCVGTFAQRGATGRITK